MTRQVRMVTNKPPKLRFKPGDQFEYENEIWTVKFIYRIKQDDRNWIIVLEDAPITSQLSPTMQTIDALAVALNKLDPNRPNLIVYDAFPHDMDAYQYFSRIPCLGTTRIHKKNKDVMAMKKVN